MKRFDPKSYETKWQEQWLESKIYSAKDNKDLKKKYVLEFFPYPSGAAMHVGHVRNYAIGDVIARSSRMHGFNVLHPMGWDGFGLPAENYAIKNKLSPKVAIKQNTDKFKKQLNQMGFSYDWDREINSTDPDYYKWTQWFFLLLFKKGLAYQQESLQWWCPMDKTVLANEQVENGQCWRCGSVVEKKALKQWFFKITDYADILLDDLEDLNWTDSIKNMQRNWIGKSKGAELDFLVENKDSFVRVFTTRADTIYGATYLVLAPEHPMVEELITDENRQKVEEYKKATEAKSDIERQETNREKTGVFTGSYAVNPATKEKIPVYISDYVLVGYGTGAIMAVPAHDQRDYDFAMQFNLSIKQVVEGDEKLEDHAIVAEGKMINSGKYDGLPSSEAREKIVADLEHNKTAKEVTNYRMRDWLISRQRYWGAPIPIIHCDDCGAVAVKEEDLPVLLPDMDNFEPSGDGRSPLANDQDFINTKCPKCGKDAKRETDTMDGFACSSWYFLRFADPKNNEKAFEKSLSDLWLPVDEYIGGAEHAVMHLLYARFWTKVMFDEGLINFKEPFTALRNQGMILAPDGNKMSKSKGNTIEPDDLISNGYGADSIRILELFLGPWDQSVNWSTEGLSGTYKFLQRVWNITTKNLDAFKSKEMHADKEIEMLKNKLVMKVTKDIEKMSFNTAIAAMMQFVNEMYLIEAKGNFSKFSFAAALSDLLLVLAPFAPHITEELWHDIGNKESIHLQNWPKYDVKLTQSEKVKLVVQINGKLRDLIEAENNLTDEQIQQLAMNSEKVKPHLSGKTLKKVIVVKNKLVNFVV
ncbi:leucine--tRNA ligase [bacterium]|nr:leucine--tRNA ligase [bacterium]